MMAATKRVALGVMAVALVAGVAGCSGATHGSGASGPGAANGAADGSAGGAGNGAAGTEKKAAGEAPASVFRLIGDGSTSFTGVQPKQPAVQRLAPGQKPPQFVVFSWDGAGEDSQQLFSHFRDVGKKYDATMSYFLSGVYLLPEAKRKLYDPPKHNAGSSDIGFNDTKESGTPSLRSAVPGWTATRSAPTSTATSAARTVASAPGPLPSGRVRSTRRSPS